MSNDLISLNFLEFLQLIDIQIYTISKYVLINISLYSFYNQDGILNYLCKR